MGGGGVFIAWVAFDHQDPPLKIRIIGQKPRGGGAIDRAADDHDVVAAVFRLCFKHLCTFGFTGPEIECPVKKKRRLIS